jgi:hypothetical protein
MDNKTVSTVERIVSVEKSKLLSYMLMVAIAVIGYFGRETVSYLKEIDDKMETVTTSQAVDHQKLLDLQQEEDDLKQIYGNLNEGEKTDFIQMPKRK